MRGERDHSKRGGVRQQASQCSSRAWRDLAIIEERLSCVSSLGHQGSERYRSDVYILRRNPHTKTTGCTAITGPVITVTAHLFELRCDRVIVFACRLATGKVLHVGRSRGLNRTAGTTCGRGHQGN
jgi:hypothetical protein